MEQNNINVVYAADDNFIPVMGVSIVSLLKNNRDMSNINVTILATNVSELNKQKVNDLFNKYDRPLPRWIDATNIEDTLGQKVNQDRGSVSQYARILDICQLVWLTKNTSYENVGGIFLPEMSN